MWTTGGNKPDRLLPASFANFPGQARTLRTRARPDALAVGQLRQESCQDSGKSRNALQKPLEGGARLAVFVLALRARRDREALHGLPITRGRLVNRCPTQCNRTVTQPQQLRVPKTGVSVDNTGCDVDDLAFCGAVQVRVGADERWGPLVERAVASGWVGIESLAGVAGSVADVTRHNASQCGQAVADTVVAVRTWDRATDAQRTFPWNECGFGGGGSRFQERLLDGSLRFEILDVAFLFKQGDLSGPVQDPELAEALGIQIGGRAPLGEVRHAINQQRCPNGVEASWLA